MTNRLARSVLSVAAALGAATVHACAGDGPTDGDAFRVQIAAVDAAPRIRHCAFPNGGAASGDVQFDIRVVNTLPDTVTVISVGTAGVIIRGNEAEAPLLGQRAYERSALPFTPTPAVLRSRDGEVTLKAILSAPCPSGFVDVQLTIIVTTTSGQYTSTPLTLRHIWP